MDTGCTVSGIALLSSLLLSLGDGQLGQGRGGRENGPTQYGTSSGEGVNKKVRSAAKTSARGSGGAGPLLETRHGQNRHFV